MRFSSFFFSGEGGEGGALFFFFFFFFFTDVHAVSLVQHALPLESVFDGTSSTATFRGMSISRPLPTRRGNSAVWLKRGRLTCVACH